MTKYMFVLLVLAIACAFSVSAVMAADLEKYDFDGKFSMEMDKGLNFEKQELDNNSVLFMDASNATGVMYIEDSQINDDFAQQFYKEYEKQGNELVGTDGNVTIFQKDGMYVAATHKDGIIVLSIGQDKDKAVNSIKTLKFS